jgi:hypothetical protein
LVRTGFIFILSDANTQHGSHPLYTITGLLSGVKTGYGEPGVNQAIYYPCALNGVHLVCFRNEGNQLTYSVLFIINGQEVNIKTTGSQGIQVTYNTTQNAIEFLNTSGKPSAVRYSVTTFK